MSAWRNLTAILRQTPPQPERSPQGNMPRPGARARLAAWLMRSVGLGLLIYLLSRLDWGQLAQLLAQLHWPYLSAAILGLFPLIWLKTVRWQVILAAQGYAYGTRPAYLAYFGSLFIGLLTPGRLGEFVKAAHVRADCGAPGSVAFVSVLTDRLFDLAALMAVGVFALRAFVQMDWSVWLRFDATRRLMGVMGLVLVLVVGGWFMRAMLLRTVARLRPLLDGLPRLGVQPLALSVALTVLAYLLYYAQCYLLARALDLPIGFVPVTYAVALGSLITLLPISISGIGTREAIIFAYLGNLGVPPEAAISFSLLVFSVFYLGSGLLGLIAWWLKPITWQRGQVPSQMGTETV